MVNKLLRVVNITKHFSRVNYVFLAQQTALIDNLLAIPLAITKFPFG